MIQRQLFKKGFKEMLYATNHDHMYFCFSTYLLSKNSVHICEKVWACECKQVHRARDAMYFFIGACTYYIYYTHEMQRLYLTFFLYSI